MNKYFARTQLIFRSTIALTVLMVATSPTTLAASPAACASGVCKLVGLFAPGVLPNVDSARSLEAHMVEYRNGQWSYNGEVFTQLGGGNWIPMLGDWDGDGYDEPGFQLEGKWFLKIAWDGPYVHGWVPANFGSTSNSVVPVVGDWNGDGKDSIGTYSNGTFVLAPDYNDFTADIRTIDFGEVDDAALAQGETAHPIIGALNGSIDRVGIMLEDTLRYSPVNTSGVYDFLGGDAGLVSGMIPKLDYDVRPVVVGERHLGIQSTLGNLDEPRNILGLIFAPYDHPYIGAECLPEFDCYSVIGPGASGGNSTHPNNSGDVIIPQNEPFN